MVLKLDPVSTAQRILKEFYIQQPEDIRELSDLKGICGSKKVFVRSDYLQNCAAKILIENDNAVIIYDNNMTYQPRIKFSIAHELGHYLLHRNHRNLFEDNEKQIARYYSNDGLEKEADEFASELLLPSILFNEAIDNVDLEIPDFNMVRSLADIFNMSITATVMKLVQCGKFCIALIACENNMIKWFYSDPEFPYRIKLPGTNLDNTTCAHDFFNSGKHFDSHEKLYADAWCTNARSEDIINEHVHCSDEFRYTLSIIWEVGDNI